MHVLLKQSVELCPSNNYLWRGPPLLFDPSFDVTWSQPEKRKKMSWKKLSQKVNQVMATDFRDPKLQSVLTSQKKILFYHK